MLPDHYTILGLTPAANEHDVRKAYKALVKLHHPDVVTPSEREKAAETFKGIMLAYQVLHDPEKRRIYDAQMMAMKAALNERVRQYKQNGKQPPVPAPKPTAKAAAPKAEPKTPTDERREGERGDPSWRNNPRHGDKINPKLNQIKEKKSSRPQPTAKKESPLIDDLPTEQADYFLQPSILPWKRGETVYVVQHRKVQWHSTWMPDTRAWKKAVHRGMALFTFRDVDSDKVLLYTHIELPEDCSGEQDMLKLELADGVVLYLNIERLPSKKNWFSVFGKKQLLKTKSRQQAKAHVAKTAKPAPKSTPKPFAKEPDKKDSETSKDHVPALKRGASADSQTPEQPTLTLAVWEAVFGCQKDVTLPTNETGTVSVPAGIQPGQTLRFIANDSKPYEILIKVRIPKELSDDQHHAYSTLKALEQAKPEDL